MAAPTRTLVQKLAADIREGKVDPVAEVERAWAADDAESVATFALAAAVAEAPLPAAKVLDAVVLLDDLQLGAVLTANVTGDKVKALLDAVERDGTSDERDALALYLAATLRTRRPFPARLLSLVRTHARRGGGATCGELLVVTAAELGDKDVSAVVRAALPDITEREARSSVASLLAGSEGPLLDWLPDYAPASLAAPLPVRASGPRPGRNNPCPCGSGKKYKKCCQDKDLCGPRRRSRGRLAPAARSGRADDDGAASGGPAPGGPRGASLRRAAARGATGRVPRAAPAPPLERRRAGARRDGRGGRGREGGAHRARGRGVSHALGRHRARPPREAARGRRDRRTARGDGPRGHALAHRAVTPRRSGRPGSARPSVGAARPGRRAARGSPVTRDRGGARRPGHRASG